MRALECIAPGQLRLTQRPMPEPAPGELLLRVRRVGLCGTDFHIFSGDQPFVSYPRIMGHELAGEVVATRGSAEFASGDRVCVMPYRSCGACVACRSGKSNCCANIAVLGVHTDGALAEYLCVPEKLALKADELELDALAMVEFLAIGRHAVQRACVETGQRILVVGAGPIGMGAALFAQRAGAQVTVVDMRAARLALCGRSLNVAHTLAPSEDLESELAAISNGEFFDVVFDATGHRAAMQRGFRFVAHGGSYVLLSIVKGDITFDDSEFHKRETTLLASRNATRADFQAVLAAMKEGAVPLAALNTHRTSLEALPDHMPNWIAPDSGIIKALIEL
ncbi:MAG: zinc-binding alcohol dehydrogenase family protein [Pseudomonadota bacterium]